MNRIEYNDKVLEYLEHLGYPGYVQYFEPEQVGEAIAKTSMLFYDAMISPRSCALSIFGLTWTYQIARVNVGESIQ